MTDRVIYLTGTADPHSNTTSATALCARISKQVGAWKIRPKRRGNHDDDAVVVDPMIFALHMVCADYLHQLRNLQKNATPLGELEITTTARSAGYTGTSLVGMMGQIVIDVAMGVVVGVAEGIATATCS